MPGVVSSWMYGPSYVSQLKTTLDLFHLFMNSPLHAEMYPLCFGFLIRALFMIEYTV